MRNLNAETSSDSSHYVIRSSAVLIYFTVVNNLSESQFHVACVLSIVNSVLIDSAMSYGDEFLKIDLILKQLCAFYLGIILILLIKFKRPWLISITLTNMTLIIVMVVYFKFHFYCLMSILVTCGCTLLDPMTNEGRPTLKLFIKAIHCENYCCFFVYNSDDRIN